MKISNFLILSLSIAPLNVLSPHISKIHFLILIAYF